MDNKVSGGLGAILDGARDLQRTTTLAGKSAFVIGFNI
jgi:hypothetical protein